MLKEEKNFLFSLLETPSPIGFESKIQEVVAKRMKNVADEIKKDVHGNLMCILNPKATKTIMLSGHCDQIGFMVKHISKEGYIYVIPLGGIDPGVLPGSRVHILTEKGPVLGIFGRKPIHHQNPDERKKMSLELEKMWIDIGAKNKKSAEAKVQVGDPIIFEPVHNMIGEDLFCGPGLDDRVGLFVVMETLRLLSKKKPACKIVAVSTVQEEVGLRGATTSSYSVIPDVSIAVDVTFANDNPSEDDTKMPEIHLGKGPTVPRGPNANEKLRDLILKTASKHKIDIQKVVEGRPTGTDANVMQISRGGSAATSIGIPNRYMHTQVETCSLSDLENTAKLLAYVCEAISNKTDFIP